jgi:hypothetical protein
MNYDETDIAQRYDAGLAENLPVSDKSVVTRLGPNHLAQPERLAGDAYAPSPRRRLA